MTDALTAAFSDTEADRVELHTRPGLDGDLPDRFERDANAPPSA
ncbi:hypothetical protein [Streptomyces clavuligerus]|nr:hypothetical protein [Streptomyces clavuligerus]